MKNKPPADEGLPFEMRGFEDVSLLPLAGRSAHVPFFADAAEL
jgi:hypothetical protein